MRAPTLRTWAIAALAAVLLAIPSTAGAVERGLDVDFTWDIPDSDFAPTQSAIMDLGAKWTRLTMHWRDAETSKGSYSSKTLGKWDKAVAAAQATGTKIIGVVGRSPSWASGSSNQYMPPQNPADYADFIRFMADRYKGKIAGWEIWNEQNSLRFWPNGPNAAQYTELLKAAYPAVKAGDPNALVLFGGLSYNDYHYVEQAYAAGAKGYFDVMVTHPYSDYRSPTDVWHEGDRIAVKAFSAYREVRKSMLANGDDKPIWFTEFGWSTTTTSWKGVSHEQQADYLTRAFCIMEQDPYVQVALWYNLRNNHWNDDADLWETQLGLMKTTFERKPSYDAFKNYNSAGCAALLAPAPEPVPLPAPEPVPLPEVTPAEATPSTTPEDDLGEIGDVSSVRRRTATTLRMRRLARATTAATRTSRSRQLRRVLHGRVRGVQNGQIRLRLRRFAPASTARELRAERFKRVRIGRDGRFRVAFRFRGSGTWRVRALYAGDDAARPSRSRSVKIRISDARR